MNPYEEKFGGGGRRKEEELEELALGVMWISWGVSNGEFIPMNSWAL